MKQRCKYCGKNISASGMAAHVSFRHRGLRLAEFRTNPAVILHCLADGHRLPPMQLALPTPNPLTVYSRRPLGFMAKPIPEHRRPKGYELDRGYARPADLLRASCTIYPIY